MCGIGAVIHNNENINNLLYEMLFNLQHRGQDSSGFIVHNSSNKKTYKCREFGLLENNLYKISKFKGNIGIGHVRYPTYGNITKDEIQPFYEEVFGGISLSHNGNITNCNEIIDILNKNHINYTKSPRATEILKNWQNFKENFI